MVIVVNRSGIEVDFGRAISESDIVDVDFPIQIGDGNSRSDRYQRLFALPPGRCRRFKGYAARAVSRPGMAGAALGRNDYVAVRNQYPFDRRAHGRVLQDIFIWQAAGSLIGRLQ